MLCGLKTSNSPSATCWPMSAAVAGVASTVRRVRATGAMQFTLTPYFAISRSMMIENAAIAALAAP